ncbi:MAG TPA: class I SAM-dependent methyltransferase [Baekduia sp.]|nr:class I SAM-dependent methyltransferase [Baekduia sp.]
MDGRLVALLDELHREGREHDARHEDRLARLRNLEPETGALLNLLLRTLDARAVLELGTSNGYSTIWLAEAVAANGGGRVTSVELDPERTAQAATNLARAGMAEVVDLQIGDAGEVLRTLPDASYDVVFLDSERPEYPGYWPDLVRVARRPGLLLCDNAISHAGELAAFRAVVDADGRAISALDHTGAGVLLISLPA